MFKDNANVSIFHQVQGRLYPRIKEVIRQFLSRLKWLLYIFYLRFPPFDRFQGASCAASLP